MDKESAILRHGAFVALIAVGVAFNLLPLKEVITLSRKSALYSHIPLIPVVSAYFLFMARKHIFSTIRWSPVVGAILLGLGLLVYGLGQALSSQLNQNDFLSTMMLGFITWIMGAFVVAYGIPCFRAAIFPMLFLLFLIPVPTFILDPFIALLQRASADASSLVFKLTGVPFYREGMVFSLPGVSVEVARQCSGIRSSLALVITSVVAGKLFLDKTVSKVGLVFAVFPVTVFKNGLRIVTLSLLGAYVSPKFLGGHWLHRSGGIPFFVVGLLLLAPVLFWLVKMEKKGERAKNYQS